MEAYMQLVKQTKNQRLQELLSATDEFLESLGRRVEIQKTTTQETLKRRKWVCSVFAVERLKLAVLRAALLRGDEEGAPVTLLWCEWGYGGGGCLFSEEKASKHLLRMKKLKSAERRAAAAAVSSLSISTMHFHMQFRSKLDNRRVWWGAHSCHTKWRGWRGWFLYTTTICTAFLVGSFSRVLPAKKALLKGLC